MALSRVPAVGAKIFRSLLHHFGTAEAVFQAPARELHGVPGIAARIIKNLQDDRPLREAERILRHADRSSVEILRAGSGNYPPSLSPYDQAPPVLYHLGETDFANSRCLAIVGTRRMTERGARQIERLLDPLSGYRPLIISGLAYGVDIAAHRRAIRLGLPTLGVLGSGLDRLYPAAHASVVRRMAGQGGGVLTEYPFWQQPEREHFPARNRIVAMLSRMILVVESGETGGSIITARMGHDLGRTVGACPGRPEDMATLGCNALIKTGHAHLVDSADDIVRLLNWETPRSAPQLRLFQDLSPGETQVVERLSTDVSLSIDELARDLQTPPSTLAGTLLGLEIREVVAALPGQRYRLKAT